MLHPCRPTVQWGSIALGSVTLVNAREIIQRDSLHSSLTNIKKKEKEKNLFPGDWSVVSCVYVQGNGHLSRNRSDQDTICRHTVLEADPFLAQ